MWCEEERWRQEGRNERTKGDNGLTYRAVIATALLGPGRPQGSDLPSYTYLPPTLDVLVSSSDLSSHRVQWDHDIPKREIWTFSQSAASSTSPPMVLDGVTTIDQRANRGESTAAPFVALEFSFWHRVSSDAFVVLHGSVRADLFR